MRVANHLIAFMLVAGVSACAASDAWPPLSLPLGSGGAGVPTLSQPGPMRVASLVDGPADAYMMAVAYRGAREVGRWGGPIDWFRVTPAQFTLMRQGRRWQWSRKDVTSLRVRAPNREDGGMYVRRWASSLRAERVSIVVVDNPGEPDHGAGTEGLGVSGQGRGARRARAAHTAMVRGPDTRGEDALDVGRGEPATGLGPDTSAPGDGAGEGTGQGDGIGDGSHDIGTRDGDEHGGENPSWYHNPRSDIAEHGGRTPADHGRAHGSASGEAGASGHANGAGWLSWIDVPVKLSGAAAMVVIVLSADISGIADRLFQKVVRGMLRADLKRELVDTAKALAQRRLKDGKRALRSRADEMSAAELAHAVDNLPASLELATFARMQEHARTRASTYRKIASGTANSQDTVIRHAHQLATENVRAWRHIEEVAGEQGRALKAAARPPGAAAGQTGRKAPTSSAAEPRLLGPRKSTKVVRNTPGTAGGGRSLKSATGNWLRGTHRNAAPLPGQVADALRGRTFRSWDAMRREVWKTVAADKALHGPFNARDIKRMQAGKAPEVDKTQSVGQLRQYVLHHRMPIQHGGGVYDLDNIVVATPRFHKEALDSKYHMGSQR